MRNCFLYQLAGSHKFYCSALCNSPNILTNQNKKKINIPTCHLILSFAYITIAVSWYLTQFREWTENNSHGLFYEILACIRWMQVKIAIILELLPKFGFRILCVCMFINFIRLWDLKISEHMITIIIVIIMQNASIKVLHCLKKRIKNFLTWCM